MIILDTNVVSELLRQPAPPVLHWLDRQAPETLFLTTITAGELRFGVALLAEGRRRAQLATAIDEVLALFAGRILSYDLKAAEQYGALAARARQMGRGVSAADGMIAAIAAAEGFSVASRDTAPFKAAGVPVIDPWRSGGEGAGG